MDWAILLSTFGLTFVAELGDKTQLAVLTQTCKFRRPWPVFLGASLALTAITAVGALGGQVIGQFIPPHVIQIVASAGFVVMGAWLVWGNVRHGAGSSQGSQGCDLIETEFTDDSAGARRRLRRQAFSSTFGLLFLAELGDKTQLAVLGLAGKYHAPWTVFLGGALALTAVTGLAVIGGHGLCRVLPERILRWLSAAAFIVIGVLMGFGVF